VNPNLSLDRVYRSLFATDRTLGRQVRDVGRLLDCVEMIVRRLTAIERSLGLVEEPQAPRPTRRVPS
jgi:hypothetical protein